MNSNCIEPLESGFVIEEFLGNHLADEKPKWPRFVKVVRKIRNSLHERIKTLIGEPE